ncbi:hypothetical protein IJI31_06485 [bacterium]|nr:hypothetical protein [bacterium]
MNNKLDEIYLQWLKQQEEQRQKSGLGDFRKKVDSIGNFGNGLSTVGDAIKNNINNEVAQKLGSSMSNIGGTIQNGTNSITGVMDKPANYFKGFANKGIENAGASLGSEGINEAIGNGLANAGTSISGGAAAFNPVTALIALGAMAIDGKNRKKAKEGSDALLKSAMNNLNEESDNAANNTQQFAQNMQNQTQDYSMPMVTGGAAPVEYPTTKEMFANSLREKGWDDLNINSALNGLNNGNKDMADYINNYNATAQEGQKITIPQTEEEINNARALASSPQTGNVQQTEQIKQGLLDKFMNGVSDLSRGYEENKNNSFRPENLAADDSKNKMTRLGEAAGTISRAVQKPAVQALLAGGISTALTGNPLYGVGMAAKYGGNRAMSNIYQNALAERGINANPGMFGTISSRDMDALMRPQYKDIEQQLMNERLIERARHNQALENHYREMENIARSKKQPTNTKTNKPNTKTTTSSGQYVIGLTPNGDSVKVPVEKVKEFKSNGGKIVG